MQNSAKQNYPGSVAFYNTQPGNEVGSFYNAPEQTKGYKKAWKPYNAADTQLGVVRPLFVGRGRRGLEIGPLSRGVVSSYRLPIVTIGLSLTTFKVL